MNKPPFNIDSQQRHATEWLEVPDAQGRITRVAPRNYRPAFDDAYQCPYLGAEARSSDGRPVMVKCDCGGGAVQIQAHFCWQFHRCLPRTSFNQQRLEQWFERPEATIYKLCQTCELNPNREERKDET